MYRSTGCLLFFCAQTKWWIGVVYISSPINGLHIASCLPGHLRYNSVLGKIHSPGKAVLHPDVLRPEFCHLADASCFGGLCRCSLDPGAKCTAPYRVSIVSRQAVHVAEVIGSGPVGTLVRKRRM